MADRIPLKSEVPARGEHEYDIPEGNMEHVQAMVDKLNRKIEKNNLKPFTLSEVLHYREYIDYPYPEGGTGTIPEEEIPVRLYTRIRLVGEEQKIGDWAFVGTIRHAGEAGNVLASAPGQHMPEQFRNSEPTRCDHCHVKQNRNDTYALHNDKTNEFKQVGGSCLREFLGMDPSRMLSYNQYFHDLGVALDESERNYTTRYHFHNEWYMSVVCGVIAKEGWVSGAAARRAEEEGKNLTATSTTAAYYAFEWKPSEHPGEEGIKLSKQDRETAKAARKWAIEGFGKAPSELDDFQRNAQVAARMEYLDARSFGIAAAVVASYLKEQARLTAPAAVAGAEWVGQPGKRDEFDVTLVEYKLIPVGASRYGAPETIGLLKMKDQKGNVLTWFSNSIPDTWMQGEKFIMLGKRFLVKATVKEHKEFRGNKETAVSRIAVLKELPSDAPSATSPAAVTERLVKPKKGNKTDRKTTGSICAKCPYKFESETPAGEDGSPAQVTVSCEREKMKNVLGMTAPAPCDDMPRCPFCGAPVEVRGDHLDCTADKRHTRLLCHCRTPPVPMNIGSGHFDTDYKCAACGQEYNCSGQPLAPRSQWGEETGEYFANMEGDY